MAVCLPVLQILTLFQTKTCKHFPHPFSDLASKVHRRFQTWFANPLPCPSDVNILFKHFLFHLVVFSSIDIFRLFLFLSYSFGVEKTNTFIRSRGYLQNHTRFQTKMAQKPYHVDRNDSIYRPSFNKRPFFNKRAPFVFLLVSARFNKRPYYASTLNIISTATLSRLQAHQRTSRLIYIYLYSLT